MVGTFKGFFQSSRLVLNKKPEEKGRKEVKKANKKERKEKKKRKKNEKKKRQQFTSSPHSLVSPWKP